ncbi:hypothetical protein [Yersinia enterocolitica]
MATIHTFTRPQNGERLQFSPETCGKLHRAQTMAQFLHTDMLSHPVGTPALWLPSALSYLADDLYDIAQEARELGQLPDTPQN